VALELVHSSAERAWQRDVIQGQELRRASHRKLQKRVQRVLLELGNGPLSHVAKVGDNLENVVALDVF